MAVPSPRWTGQGKGTAPGYLFFILMVRFFGLLPAYFFLAFIVIRYLFGDPKSRDAIRSFRGRLGLSTSIVEIYRHFYSFGMSLIDRFAFLQLEKPPFRYTCINENLIADTAAAGKGVILLCAHVGNWEIAGNLLNDRIKVPINIVMLDAEKESLQRAMSRVLEQRRMKLIAVNQNGTDTMIQIINALRRGEIVAMPGDRVMDNKAERIAFLGSPALFPVGAFAVAAITGAPIIPIVNLKHGLRHYTFKAWAPIRLPQTDRVQRQQTIRSAMEEYVRILETVVKEYPHQWYNFFEFWE